MRPVDRACAPDLDSCEAPPARGNPNRSRLRAGKRKRRRIGTLGFVNMTGPKVCIASFKRVVDIGAAQYQKHCSEPKSVVRAAGSARAM